MSNHEKTRKLLPHQRPIWRKTFEASMQHTSVESAERKAWVAVDIWERVGAFNDPQSFPATDLPDHVLDWQAAWNHLGETIQGCSKGSHDWECRLSDAMCDYSKGEMSLDEFKEEVDLIFRDPTE